MKLHTFGVLCSLGILFAPFTNCASTCNNCYNIDCSQSYGNYNQCYQNCCPSSQCESNCHSNECRANCQLSSCQNNCQTSECRSGCQVSRCQSNCQSNLCKSHCEQNRCQTGSCYERPSPCSASMPCDIPRPAAPCPLSATVVNGMPCTAPNVTVNASPSISLPKITVNIHQGAVNVGPIQVHNNFTLSCGNGTAPCSRPPRIVHMNWPHPIPPPPAPQYPRWNPQPVVTQPCCQYLENRCVNNVCYPQQISTCGEQCVNAPAQSVQQCPWYGCQQAPTAAPCVTGDCQSAPLPIEQPQLPIYGSAYDGASYYDQQAQLKPEPAPDTQTHNPYPLPTLSPESYPQPYPYPYPQPQPLPQLYPQPQLLPQLYPQAQPLPLSYPQSQSLPLSYPQSQPLPLSYSQLQPLPQQYPYPQQPLSQPSPKPHTVPVVWESLPANCLRIQHWPYIVCHSELIPATTNPQGTPSDVLPGSYAPRFPGYNNTYAGTPNRTVIVSNGTLGVPPKWSSASNLLLSPTASGREVPDLSSDESFEYEDDQPESARSNVTRT